MKFHREIYIEKKLSKYIFSKDKKVKKRNKSKSPSSISADDIENIKQDTKINLFDNKVHNLFTDKNDFLLESKLKIRENPFLSSIKKNPNFSNNINNDSFGKTFMKLRGKIIINDDLSEFIDNFDLNENNLNLLDDVFISSDIFSNNEILSSDLKNNIINNEKKEETKKNPFINPLENFINKEKIVIEALSFLDKDYMNNKDKNSVMIKFEDYDSEKNYFEEIFELSLYKNNSDEKISEYKQKKYIYEVIDNRIKLYYDYYKKNKSYKMDETETEINNYKKDINNILNIESLSNNFLFYGFKSIVLSLYTLVIRWLSNSHFKVYLNSTKEDNINLDIFILLMEKYNTIKDICPFLEKDFKEIIENYQQKKDIKFCLCELLTDLYWDYVFKIHKINNMFTSCYKLDNTKKNVIFEEAKHAMKSIVDILIVNDTSYKKNIGEQLKLPYMKKENIFLMTYINKSKKTANPFEIKNPFVEQNNKNSDKEKSVNNNANSTDENNTNVTNKEKDEEKNIEENKNPDNFTLDEVYKYIVGEDKNENKKNKKKNKKKKKKNKKEETKNPEPVEAVDPVVEEFIQYFIEFNKYKDENYTKIKPNISEEWIKSIS